MIPSSLFVAAALAVGCSAASLGAQVVSAPAPAAASPAVTPGADEAPATPDAARLAGDLASLLGRWRVSGRTLRADRRWAPLDGTLSLRAWHDGAHRGVHETWFDAARPDTPTLVRRRVVVEEPGRWVSLPAGSSQRVDFVEPYATRDLGDAVALLATTQHDGTGLHQMRGRVELDGHDAWSLLLERSYDAGANWFPVEQLDARRVGAAPPTLRAPDETPLAGEVDTLLEGFGGSRALAIDDAGGVYLAAEFDGAGDPPLLRVAPDGSRRVVATGLRPAGLAWWNGFLYVHAHDVPGGRVVRLGAHGTIEDLGPGGGDSLCVDDEGNAYTIHEDRVTQHVPGAAPREWARAPELRGALASAYDPSRDAVIFAGFAGSEIRRITEGGAVELLSPGDALHGSSLAWMTRRDDALYVTAFGAHRVYRWSADEGARLVAGRGVPGGRDGELGVARFRQPNGIALSDDGRTLYVSELLPGPAGPFALGRLRRIRFAGD